MDGLTPAEAHSYLCVSGSVGCVWGWGVGVCGYMDKVCVRVGG